MIELAENRYGKSRVRLMKVTRHPHGSDLREWAVQVLLQGDFDTAHIEGDVVQKNLIIAEGAKFDGISQGSPIFSPDSKHACYLERRGNQTRLAVAEGTLLGTLGFLGGPVARGPSAGPHSVTSQPDGSFSL